MIKQLTMLSVSTFFVLIMGLHTQSNAGSEKGPKKCSDTIDNDDDGLIDLDDPDCGGDGGSGGIGVLLDATGATIGKVVGIQQANAVPFVEILFEMSGQTLLAKIVTEHPDGELPGFDKVEAVFFDNADCTGAAWIMGEPAFRGHFFNEFQTAIIVGDKADDPDERLLYVPVLAAAELRTANSIRHEQCDPNTTITTELVPAVLLDADLHTTFPKPYTLRLN